MHPPDATSLVASALVAVDRLDPMAPDLIDAAKARATDADLWPLALLASTRWSIATGDLISVLDEADRAMAAQAIEDGTLAASTVAAARARALVLLGESAAAARALEPVLLGGGHDVDTAAVLVRMYVDGPAAALAAARRLVVGAGVDPAFRAEAMLFAAWAQLRLGGVVEPGTAEPLGALVAREGLWRVLQLVPQEVVEAVPWLEAAPPVRRRLTIREPEPSVRLTSSELKTLRLLAGPNSIPEIARAVRLGEHREDAARIDLSPARGARTSRGGRRGDPSRHPQRLTRTARSLVPRKGEG